jgi:dTDP-4-amino-4,6-dideoxygalactose transaminase
MSQQQGEPVNIFSLETEIEENWAEINHAVQRVIKSGMFILGSEVNAFEEEAAKYLGAKHAISCANGTDALIISLRALDIKAGDEVITTPFSFFASAESICLVGAKPQFVDVDLDTMNMDMSQLEAAITEKTKAIMPVHLFGLPANMDALMEIAERRGIAVIEDTAQAFGARVPDGKYQGQSVGCIGTTGTYSFFPTKNLGCYGDGGMISTNDDEVAKMCRMIRFHGSNRRYHHEMIGMNSRLDALQAAILRLKLPMLDGYNAARVQVAKNYASLLEGVEGIITPEVRPGHIFHQYTIRVLDGRRDELQEKLRDKAIGSIIYYPIPQDRLEVFEGQYDRMPNSDTLAEQVLSLPIHPYLKLEQQQRVAAGISEIL